MSNAIQMLFETMHFYKPVLTRPEPLFYHFTNQNRFYFYIKTPNQVQNG